MMLNIDSEPMATPITNPRRAKKLRSTSGASARDSTISSRTNAAAASTNGPTTGSGAAPTCGSACNPKTSDTMNVASKTKPSSQVAYEDRGLIGFRDPARKTDALGVLQRVRQRARNQGIIRLRGLLSRLE